jgi:hypothetical protein
MSRYFRVYGLEHVYKLEDRHLGDTPSHDVFSSQKHVAFSSQKG